MEARGQEYPSDDRFGLSSLKADQFVQSLSQAGPVFLHDAILRSLILFARIAVAGRRENPNRKTKA